MATRACLTCGRSFTPTTYKQRRCDTHEPRGRASRSPTTRAQDAEYARNRKIVLTGNPPCIYCGNPATTADHAIPVALGGSNHLSNLEPACDPCNSSKQDRPAPSTRVHRHEQWG